jgi:putative flippase GtrA
MILTNKKERGRFLRFLVVGTIGALVDVGIFNLVTNFSALGTVNFIIFGIPINFGEVDFLRNLTSVEPVPASIISFTAAVANNFLWNRYWTYPDSRAKRIRHQLTQFFIINIIGLVIRTPLFAFLEPRMITLAEKHAAEMPLSSTTVGHNISLAIAVGVVLLWNFFANRFWTYSDVSK